jgi:hypothetical protein
VRVVDSGLVLGLLTGNHWYVRREWTVLTEKALLNSIVIRTSQFGGTERD